MPENYYDILGIPKDANAEDIKKAYRKKAMESHPDRHGGDKEKEAQFKKINEAYQTLSDAQKKAHYDRFGSTEGMGQGGFGQGFSGQGFDANFDISDIFESFFGGGGFGGGGQSKRKKNESGEDIEIEVKLDFSEAVLGTKRKVSYEKMILCSECSGSGAKKGTSPKTCNSCHGNGYVKKRTQSFFGVIEQTVVCDVCHGNGQIIEEKCGSCNGNKRIRTKMEKEIDVPAGIDDGMTLKLKGEGGVGVNSKSGDLYIVFRVPQKLEGMKRDGVNLNYDLVIDPIEAILGSKRKIKFPILGERTIEIKPGTQNSDMLKFKGDGVKDVSRDFKGDLFVKIDIKIPTSISKKERELYEQIAKEKGIDFADGKGFFSKIF
ncbi:MAG: J domain-containing protein [Candidatus Gracilibacteria bacterium]|nr:J domain-containing protein [Candidatus Gracilibacteria bacterium]